MGRTAFFADGVLQARAAARDANARGNWHRAERRSSRATRERTTRGGGAWRFMPVVVGAATLGVGACAGTAYAVFTATATGTADTSVGTLHAVVVLPATGNPATSLFPGTSAPLRLTLTNPNSHAVIITAIAQDGAVVVVGGTGCTSANAGVSVPTQSSLSITLTPGTHSFTLPTGASMATTSNSGCQGASFQIPVTVTVRT